jgi:ABC-type transporter Mla subunit MlaD
MEPLKPTFTCAVKDLPVIGQFVLTSLRRDLPELATRSIKYQDKAFVEAFAAALKKVEELVNPAVFTAQHKKLTEQIDADSKTIRPLLNNLEIRLADADELPATGPQLTINPADSGISQLRKAISNRDVEGIIYHGKNLLHHLTDNAEVLKLVAYPETEREELDRLLTALADANVAQNALISARDAKVQANLHVLNSFFDEFLNRVLADGKKAFKESAPAKMHDYTMSRLKARVTAQRPPQRRRKDKPDPDTPAQLGE